ncbi:antitoxin Xre/MbcA/ParS toxin-binding domain-containing protein [Pseudomonas sp. Irchel 3H3]|jgi:putative toxin-antitoxin system antitoxin component (TIGR02293 family)|uniref:type II RES/Xre toxin-antitoxin system antitoxin n=1 Tax=unclassified Pseudomonas TaxID=196821 RepID=UPI000BA3BB1A|nr:antitoxin Xre/MbcA/ParS toxin-binding domain-containing protein [Pseudomonas sp. Irchel 3H3]
MIAAGKESYPIAYDPIRPLQLLFGEGKKLKATSAFELHALMEKGFPSDLVISFVQSYSQFRDHHVFSKIIGLSDRTVQRRIKSPEPLTAEQTNGTWRLATVLSKAEEVLGDRQQAVNWMTSPAMGLEGKAPIDLLTTQMGFELVEDFLTRMEYGVYS